VVSAPTLFERMYIMNKYMSKREIEIYNYAYQKGKQEVLDKVKAVVSILMIIYVGYLIWVRM